MPSIERIGMGTLLQRLATEKGHEYFPSAITIDRETNVAEWVKTVKKKLLPKLKMYLDMAKHVDAQPIENYRLLSFKTLNVLWWALITNTHAIYGMGTLQKDPHFESYNETTAVLFHKEMRGKRLYPRILKSLRKTYGYPIDSDQVFIGFDAVRSWKRMGFYKPSRERFRLRKNPARWYYVDVRVMTPEDFRAFLNRQATEPCKER